MKSENANKRLSKEDKEISKRLLEIRNLYSRTQDEFSSQCHLPRGSYANYEYAVTPIPADVALRICRTFIINEHWLATGEGPLQPCANLLLDHAALIEIKPGELFSVAYPRVLKKRFDEWDRKPLSWKFAHMLDDPANDRAQFRRIFEFAFEVFDMLLDDAKQCSPKEGTLIDARFYKAILTAGFKYIEQLHSAKKQP